MIYEISNSTDDQLRFYRVENYSNNPRLHKNLEIVFCRSGRVQVTISGKNCMLTAGQGAVIPPNAVHNFQSEQGCVFYVIQAGLQNARDVAQLFRDRVPSGYRFCVDDNMQQQLDSTFALGRDGCNLFDMKALLYRAVGTFVRTNTFAPGQSADAELLPRAIRYVQDHFRGALTLEDVAQHLGYSYSYVSKQIKQGLGMSFSEFLTEYRIGYARALLNEGNISISQAALQSGFGSIRNFNRAFLQLTGKTPRDYLKGDRGIVEDGRLLLELERE